jgi:hypothetical protein
MMEPINHNQSRNPQTMMTQDFFTEVHLLAGKLVLVVVIHSLEGSHANWHHTPNPQ